VSQGTKSLANIPEQTRERADRKDHLRELLSFRTLHLPSQMSDPLSPAIGEQQGADDRGEETSRRMNAGPRVARVACDCAYTPPSESRCFGPVVATADWSTTRRCARLAMSKYGPDVRKDTCLHINKGPR
jgi:hypothetical protein